MSSNTIDASAPMSLTSRLLQLLLLSLATLAVSYARIALSPLQEAMRADLALSDNQIALLQGVAVGLPIGLGSIPLGMLFGLYSRASLFFLFIALGLGGMLLAAFAPGFLLIFVARMMIGFCFAAVVVNAYWMVSDFFPPEQRGRATTTIMIAENGAGPLAFAVGGHLLTNALADGATLGMAAWRETLLHMALPVIPITLLMFALQQPNQISHCVRRLPFREIWPQLWSYRGVAMPLLLTRSMVWIADGAVLAWGVSVFARSYGLSASQTGYIMASALLVGGLLGPTLGGALADYCQRSGGASRAMTSLTLLMLASVPAGMFALSPNILWATIGITAFLALGCAINVGAFALSSIVLPIEMRAPYFQLSFTVCPLVALAIAPLLVSLLSGLLGGKGDSLAIAVTIVCAATSISGTILFLYSRQYFRR